MLQFTCPTVTRRSQRDDQSCVDYQGLCNGEAITPAKEGLCALLTTNGFYTGSLKHMRKAILSYVCALE